MVTKRLNLHKSGPNFSRISLGLWRLHEWDMSTTDLTAYVEEAIELGITTFDHADIYGSYGNEELFGKLLKQKPELRERIEIVSKCGICLVSDARPENHIQHYNTTSDYIRMSVDRSLKKLQTDYLDLILIHRPDPLMNTTEMADIFSLLLEEEKVKHVGVSNFTPSQFDLFQSKMEVPLVTNQVECSLLHLDPIYDGTFDQAQKLNRSPMIWSPFAGGRIFTDDGDRAQKVRNLCKELAENYNTSVDQIALAWLFELPCNPQAVIGTGRSDRMKSAVKAMNVPLERQDWYRLLEAANGHPVP